MKEGGARGHMISDCGRGKGEGWGGQTHVRAPPMSA